MVRLNLIVVSIALVLNLLDGYDVVAMSFTVDAIGRELQIPVERLGIVFSVALAGMMVGSLFLAPLSDSIGRRSLTLVCVAVIGSSMVATAFVTNLWQLVLCRALTGLGVGAMLASLTALCSEYASPRYQSLAVMAMTAGYPLGATIGGLLAARLLPNYGWNSIFLLGGAATLSMLILVYVWVPESAEYLLARRPKGALKSYNTIRRRLGDPPLSKLPKLHAQDTVKPARVSSLLRSEFRRKTLSLWATFFFCVMGVYFLLSWIPKLGIDAGLTESQGAYASSLHSAGGVLGILTVGLLAARLSIFLVISASLLIASSTMLLFAGTNNLDHLYVYLIVIGFFLHGGFTGLYAVAAKLYPVTIRGTGIGWAIGLGRLGAVIGPYIGGLMISNGFSMGQSFTYFAIPVLMAAMLAFQLKTS